VTLNLEKVDSQPAYEPPPERPAKTPFWRRPPILPLFAIVVFYLYIQATPFLGVPEADAPIPPHAGFPLYYPFLIAHMCGGTLAMLTMCAQVWPWLRVNHPKAHRVTGRLYLAGAYVAGFAALVVVWFAPNSGKVGALCMAVFWLGVSTAAWVSARRRNYVAHRRFMLYSFAIASNNIWAASTFLVLTKLGVPFNPGLFAEGARWIPWVGNLMLVQWWLYRTARRKAQSLSELPSVTNSSSVS
jgi:uncharacterized membrane protein YozB (DUF420 family)